MGLSHVTSRFQASLDFPWISDLGFAIDLRCTRSRQRCRILLSPTGTGLIEDELVWSLYVFRHKPVIPVW